MALLASNPRYIRYLKFYSRKISRQLMSNNLRYQEDTNWHWLKENPVPIAGLNRSIWRLSVASFSFQFMLGLSAIIATLGLISNSAAVIIGAMIIAPLMGPILGMAYSIAMGNRKLLRCASLTILRGILLTIFIAWITSSLIGLKTVDTEILSRTQPTLIDFGIAMAAGLAGSYAHTRRSISSALPGVAIAVALVPPLSVVGIGLALQSNKIAIGALLLFLTNLTCIIFFGSLIFLFQSYGNFKRAKKGLVTSTVFMFFLAIPLTFSMRDLVVEKNVSYQVKDFILSQSTTFANFDVRSIQVAPEKNYLRVSIEVAAPLNSISQNQINLVKEALEGKIGSPIDLRVEVIPRQILNSAYQ